MSNSIIIRFKPKGDKELIRSLKTLSNLQIQLERGMKKTAVASGVLGTSFKRNQKRATALGNTFSTARSKMLLFSFAMSLGGRQLIDFGKKAATIESMGAAFANLAGGSQKASNMLVKLKQATDGTMSSMDLFQQANNAMILGITKNSNEMAEMFDMAQRLGKALGRDTKSSVESLITGIGRQSRLMLDNIGIIVKSEKAYEKYANELGITAEQLTDTEKRQAFLTATLEAARENLSRAGQETLDNQQKYAAFGASLDNLSSRVGNLVNMALVPLVEALTKVADSIDEETILSYGTAIGIATSAWGAYTLWQNRATLALLRFNKALVRSGWGAAIIGLGFLIDKLGIFDSVSKDIVKSNIAVTKSIHDMTVAEMKLELQTIQSAKTRLLAATNWLGVMEFSGDKRIKELEREIKVMGDFKKTYGEFLEAQDKGKSLYQETTEFKKASILSDIDQIKTGRILIENEEEKIAVLEMLRLKLLALGKLGEIQKNLSSGFADIFMEAQKLNQLKISDFGDHVVNVLKRIIAEAVATQLALHSVAQMQDFLAGIADRRAGVSSEAGAPLQLVSSFLKSIPILGSFLDLFFHSGGHVQGYSNGGITSSQGGADNVPAVLQEGEYVMRRSAVESIGIENLNRMNRTGQSAGVSISFTGNVLSDSFIEDEAIPKIKKAIRRGADLGIA